MHGGIGRSINHVEQIESLQRPITMEAGSVVLMDLLWYGLIAYCFSFNDSKCHVRIIQSSKIIMASIVFFNLNINVYISVVLANQWFKVDVIGLEQTNQCTNIFQCW